jgi:hypothetical protein
MIEKEERVSIKTKVGQAILAVIIMVAIAGVVYATTIKPAERPDPANTLTYTNLKLYEMNDSSATEHACKAINTRVTYFDDLKSVVIEVEGADTEQVYIEAEKIRKNQVRFKDKNGEPVTFTNLGDSVMVVVEAPYFVILSNTKECVTLEQLPTSLN